MNQCLHNNNFFHRPCNKVPGLRPFYRHLSLNIDIYLDKSVKMDILFHR